MTISDGDTKCDTAYLTMKCFFEKAPEVNISFDIILCKLAHLSFIIIFRIRRYHECFGHICGNIQFCADNIMFCYFAIEYGNGK